MSGTRGITVLNGAKHDNFQPVSLPPDLVMSDNAHVVFNESNLVYFRGQETEIVCSVVLLGTNMPALLAGTQKSYSVDVEETAVGIKSQSFSLQHPRPFQRSAPTFEIPFATDSAIKPAVQIIDLQIGLRDQIRDDKQPGQWVWRDSGSFEESFPSLGSIYKPYRTLELHEVDSVLRAELKRSGDNVEAFGLKIPADVVRRWGIWIVFAVLLYFSRHLRFLLRLHGSCLPDVKSAWIGLYDDVASRTASIITCSVIPILATFILYYAGTERNPNTLRSWLSFLWEGGEENTKWRIFALGGIFGCVVLALCIVRDMRRLHQLYESQPLRT